MASRQLTRRICALSPGRLLTRIVKSGGFFCVLLLIPGLSCPSIISKGQSRENALSDAFAAGVGTSGAIDATALYAFPNTGPADTADRQLPGETFFPRATVSNRFTTGSRWCPSNPQMSRRKLLLPKSTAAA